MTQILIKSQILFLNFVFLLFHLYCKTFILLVLSYTHIVVSSEVTISKVSLLLESLSKDLFVSAQLNQLIHLIHLNKPFVSLFLLESVDFFYHSFLTVNYRDDSLSGKSMLSITHNFHYEAYSGVSPVKIGFFFKKNLFCRQLPQRNFGKNLPSSIYVTML